MARQNSALCSEAGIRFSTGLCSHSDRSSWVGLGCQPGFFFSLNECILLLAPRCVDLGDACITSRHLDAKSFCKVANALVTGQANLRRSFIIFQVDETLSTVQVSDHRADKPARGAVSAGAASISTKRRTSTTVDLKVGEGRSGTPQGVVMNAWDLPAKATT